jgi:hypothetical protein
MSKKENARLKFFTAPENYSDYTFWRSEHHRYALLTILGAAAFWLGRWIL